MLSIIRAVELKSEPFWALVAACVSMIMGGVLKTFRCTDDRARRVYGEIFVVRRAVALHYSVRICGNKITSRIDGASVNSITSRSMPIPHPPVGGRPYSIARM